MNTLLLSLVLISPHSLYTESAQTTFSQAVDPVAEQIALLQAELAASLGMSLKADIALSVKRQLVEPELGIGSSAPVLALETQAYSAGKEASPR